MKKKVIKGLIKTFKVILVTVISLFLLYAVLFSVALTYAGYKAYQYAIAPLNEVRALATVNPAETSFMQLYREELRRQGKPDSLTQTFIPLDSISSYLKETVLAAEDDGFFVHPGIDIEAILSAHEYNMRHNKIKRGGSTITQQIAKNLFLSNQRNFERKAKELAYTLLMEKYLGKKRILELYLNYAQWGPRIFGCEAAARHYFKKSAKDLNRMESVRLAAVLVSPGKMSPTAPQTGFLWARIQVIAANLYLHHQINDTGYQTLTGQFPPDSMRPKPATTVESTPADSTESPSVVAPPDSSEPE